MATPTADELQNEGLRLFQEGLYDEAAQRFSEALEHFSEEGREIEAGEMLNNIGIIRRKQSRWDEALESLEEARRIFESHHPRRMPKEVIARIRELAEDH